MKTDIPNTVPALPASSDRSDLKKEIWFIHGANASPASFNYIKDHLKKDEHFQSWSFIDITYNCQEKLPNIVNALTSSLPRDKEIFLVGHSLGGVLATAVAQRISHFNLQPKIAGVITMASPFGGSESADYLKWIYPAYYLFKSISTQSKMILDLKALGAMAPTLSLVTTSGNNPLISAANDGVVTVNSQRALSRAKYIEVPFNHFEVLVSAETINYLRIFLKNPVTV